MSTNGHALDYKLRPAWRLDDPVVTADAKTFWKRLNLLGPQEIERRAGEVCAAAYLGEELIAVSTTPLMQLESLKARFGMFRCAIAPNHPRDQIAPRLAVYCRALLEPWSKEHANEKVVGMAAIIPAFDLRERQAEPVWSDNGLNLGLVGYTPTGEQIRVSWFAHARLG